MNKILSILSYTDYNYMSLSDCESLFFPTPLSTPVHLVHAAPVYQIQATLIELDWWGPQRPLLSPQGLCECVWIRNWEWELVCVLEGSGALASDWVFREQRGVRKPRQWSNRISSLWWMVCESSTDSSLSQTHRAASVYAHARVSILHPLVQGLFVRAVRATHAGMSKSNDGQTLTRTCLSLDYKPGVCKIPCSQHQSRLVYST